MSHSNISIFVPHLGCPHQCSFCNQRYITGQSYQPCAEDIHNAVSIAVSSSKYCASSCEIAFFGGSFTAIDKEYMTELLRVAYRYVSDGTVSGIRISTRPDCINDEILTVLKYYGVTAIELGAQSMVNSVLVANNRGHLAEDIVHASMMIRNYGFELGLQMMTGLYESKSVDDIYTAKKIIEIKPETVRIYPTIVVKNTDLEALYLTGKYAPQSLESAVSLCVSLEDMFIAADIKVIRVGLHTLEHGAYVAGPWHPAFRELCETERFRIRLNKTICSAGSYNVFVSPEDVSKVIGQKRSNINYFKEKNINIKVISDLCVKSNNFIVKEVK